MNLKQYLDSLPTGTQKDFAILAGTSPGYLRQLKFGKKPSAKLCHRLVAASGGRMTLAELRPDIYAGLIPLSELNKAISTAHAEIE